MVEIKAQKVKPELIFPKIDITDKNHRHNRKNRDGIIKMNTLHPYRFRKIENFLNLGFVSKQCVLAGGSLRTLIDPLDEVKDYDLFPLGNKKQKSNIRREVTKMIKDQGGNIISNSNQLVTLMLNDTKIQIVTIDNEYYQSPIDVINRFDLDLGRLAWDGESLFVSQRAVHNIHKKYISVHKVRFAVATFKRLARFQVKGYYITDALRYLIKQLQDPNTDIDVETEYLE